MSTTTPVQLPQADLPPLSGDLVLMGPKYSCLRCENYAPGPERRTPSHQARCRDPDSPLYGLYLRDIDPPPELRPCRTFAPKAEG
jgi:hypothetical protein